MRCKMWSTSTFCHSRSFGFVHLLVLVVILILILPTRVRVSAQSLCSADPVTGYINQTYNYVAKSDNTCTFNFDLDLAGLTDDQILDKKVQLYVAIDDRSNKENWKQPLMVSVRQQLSNTIIILPHTFEEDAQPDSYWYYSAKRTLCLPKPKKESGFKRNSKIIITVDTSNAETGIGFTFFVTMVDHLKVDVGDMRTVTVAPLAPTYFRYDYGPGVDMIEVLFTSTGEGTNICTIVAADNPFCPIYDMEENIGKVSEYKKMTAAAVIRLRKADYKKGLVILIIPLSSDETCKRYPEKYATGLDVSPNPEREKNVTLTIRAVEDFNLPWMFGIQLLCIFVPCIVVTLFVFCVCDRRLKRSFAESLKPVDQVDEATVSMMTHSNSITDDTIMMYQDVINEAEVSNLRKKYNRYCTVTVFISAFYVIPVYQFIYYHWKSMGETGNYDHCYYNELCRIKIHELSDFNHFISNLLYVVFGLTFIGFVYWRSCTLFDTPQYLNCKRGLRVPFGAYMAMGLSLIMEGVLSSAYHFCPSSSTFQFDVAFMYVIAIILLSTIHQLRYHANPSGTKGFILLTILTVVSALFYMLENVWSQDAALVCRLIFCAFHIGFMAFYCLGLYYHGMVKNSQGQWHMGFYTGIIHVLTPPRFRIKLQIEEMRLTPNPDRSVRKMKISTLVILFLLNAAASIWLAITEDFAHYLLSLLIANVLASVIIYISWKIFYWNHRNKMNTVTKRTYSLFLYQTSLYFILAFLFGMCGLRKFGMELTEWRKTAAESRVLNKPCSDFWSNYYDHHDVWHFFSAVALFFSFMGLLTIDDGIIMEDRRNIHLF